MRSSLFRISAPHPEADAVTRPCVSERHGAGQAEASDKVIAGLKMCNGFYETFFMVMESKRGRMPMPPIPSNVKRTSD